MARNLAFERTLSILVALCALSGAPSALRAAETPALPPQVVSSSNRDPDWRPTPSQETLVQRRTVAYFAARDGNHFEEAFAMFSPTQKVNAPFDAWRSSIKGFNERAGGISSRSLLRVTWYRDPPGRTGTFAAVDFSTESANLALHCGYVVWAEQPDGTLAVLREEENALDRAAAEKLNPGDLERMREKFHCQ